MQSFRTFDEAAIWLHEQAQAGTLVGDCCVLHPAGTLERTAWCYRISLEHRTWVDGHRCTIIR